MAKDPGLGFKVTATITGVKGLCNAGHREGDTFEISCHNPSEMCGLFFHSIFPNLMTFQYGGGLPWWNSDAIYLHCPDPQNLVTVKLERAHRE
ncbi:MAG: TIGR04076 family protein [Solirubrobacterales bacterium]